MLRIIGVIAIVLAAHGIARADHAWNIGAPLDLGEDDGWEIVGDASSALRGPNGDATRSISMVRAVITVCSPTSRAWR